MCKITHHLNQELFNIGRIRKNFLIKIMYSKHRFLHTNVLSVENPSQESLPFSDSLLFSGTLFEGF